jgi:hypothetical protein
MIEPMDAKLEVFKRFYMRLEIECRVWGTFQLLYVS